MTRPEHTPSTSPAPDAAPDLSYVLEPGPHPSWQDPDRFARDGCSHGRSWADACPDCRTDWRQGCYHRPDLAHACQACLASRERHRPLLLRLFDWFCDRFILTNGPR